MVGLLIGVQRGRGSSEVSIVTKAAQDAVVRAALGTGRSKCIGTICGFKMELYDMKRRLRHASALDDGGKHD
jgi:hypothetical protein